MIQVKNLSVSFGQVEVLHSVSCEFPPGQITGIMGRNGSGKTVLLKAICGLVVPGHGEIWIDDRKLTPQNAHTFSMGALIETPGFLREYSGSRNLQFIASLTPGASSVKVKRVMSLVGLDYTSKKRVGTYSLGMRQRLGVAQALLDDPDILILDEPMNGLDHNAIENVRSMLHELTQEGKTILLASHYADDLEELCKTIYQIDNGEIVNQ